MKFSEKPDGRPVEVDDLVAAVWKGDKEYSVGIVNNDQRSLFKEKHVAEATHVISLKKSYEIRRIVDKAKKAFWESIVQDFSEVESRPHSTIDFNDACAKALHNWLNLRYPISLIKQQRPRIIRGKREV